MTKYDVALYGNLIYDRFCFDDNRDFSQTGGIGNVARHLKKINPALKVKIVPLWKGYAIFHVNCVTKLDGVNMNEFDEGNNNLEGIDAAWHHLSYANCVGKYAYARHYDSMDVSPSGGRMLPITTTVAFRNVGFNPYHPDSFVWNYITHHEGGSILSTFTGSAEVRHRKLKLGFTVGAGDMLVAEVINELLPDPGRPMEEIIKKCHSNVVKELKREQAYIASAGSRKSGKV